MLLSDLLLVLGGCLFLWMKSFTIIGVGLGVSVVWVGFGFFLLSWCALCNCLAPASTENWSVYFRIFLTPKPWCWFEGKHC